MKNHLAHCVLCPRRCGVDRLAGQRGYCQSGSKAEIFRFGPHRGEEPPISGQRGSGTVFFSRCTLRCLYCQNYPWSQNGRGDAYSQTELDNILRSLHSQGCHNWNFVSPSPWLPLIHDSVTRLRTQGLSLPTVSNTSGYEAIDILHDFSDLFDVFLVDLRYADSQSAEQASDCRNYVQIAREAVREMWRIKGKLRMDNDGVAQSGVICRLLILPNRAGETVENLRWLADQVGTEIAVSVMAQYMPAYKAAGTVGWDRPITFEEYEQVRQTLEDIGFAEGWMQEFGVPSSHDLIGYEMPRGGCLASPVASTTQPIATEAPSNSALSNSNTV